MSTFLFNIIILIVGAFSVIIGFRRGFTGQICEILGIAFGSASAHLLAPSFAESLLEWLPFIRRLPFPDFALSLFSASIIYIGVFLLFSIFTTILRSAVSIFQKGMLNRLIGSFVCLLENLLFLSIFYNFILCYNIDSPLLKYAGARDGNMVESVMMLSSVFLGCESVHELVHDVQLREAKKISYNFNNGGNVITTEENKEKSLVSIAMVSLFQLELKS